MVGFYLLLFFLGSVVCKGGPRGHMSNEWLMKLSDRSINIRGTIEKYGFEVVSQPFPGYFLMKESIATPGGIDLAAMQRDKQFLEPKIDYMRQLQYQNMSYRGSLSKQTSDITINDDFWDSMWHLNIDQFPSMHVYDVWQMGYTGSGVHVTILDDGVEPTHADLDNNYAETFSFNFVSGSSYVNHTDGDYHGTLCSGVVAAEKNNDCVLGVAYESSFSSVKIFDAYSGITEADSALALTHALDQTDIYSNSWGPLDSGTIFSGPSEIEQAALEIGVTDGRDGKGVIYTWANGNGGIDDDCNCDGYANSIYTIGVTSVGKNQEAAWYAEACSSVFVGTYGGSSPDPMIATTSTGNSCTVNFQGTSAACPMASGIIALVLQARPDLTWRDVQHLIVETASKEGLIRADWQTNGAGKQISHLFGFGLMNASAMVTRGASWNLVPGQTTCETNFMQVNSDSDNGVYIESSVNSDGCSGGVRYVEHVTVWMTFRSTYRGETEIRLISPQGTRSVLLHERTYDYYNGTTEWTFMTVQCWGENPSGTWTLQIEGLRTPMEIGLESWQMVVYGTSVDPINGASESDDNSVTYGIIGGVVGGVAVISVVGGVAFFLIKKSKAVIHPTTD